MSGDSKNILDDPQIRPRLSRRLTRERKARFKGKRHGGVIVWRKDINDENSGNEQRSARGSL